MKLVNGAWKLLVGLKDGLVLLFMLLFFGALFAILSYSPNPKDSLDGALLVALDGGLVEQPEAADARAILSGQAPAAGQVRLRDVVHALETAAGDDDVKTVVLDLDNFMGGGQVALSRVGAALERVKAAKKPVLAFATAYSDDAYQLASHASDIWLDPMGGVLFAGPGGSRLYYKGLIDRIGANVHVYRVGKFKSFVEPYTRSDQSPEARAASQSLADILFANWQAEVTKARPQAKIAGLIADPAGTVSANGNSLSKAALTQGIVDQLGDATAFGKRVAKLAGSDDDKPVGNYNKTDLADYIAANPPPSSGSAIGVVTVAGAIVDGEAAAGSAGGETIARLIRSAVAEKDLKALVVRIDSGGGSARASEVIRSALVEAKATGIPVIASMGNVAASGGYWVAMAGDKVFAEPSTITGSIGVFGILPTFENVLSKYGVAADGVKTTPLSGQPDLFDGTNAATDTLFQAGVEDIYSQFLTLVSTTRKMPVAKVDEMAQGRVWDGGTARQLGLIDQFGSLDDAIAEAAKRAKVEPGDAYTLYLEPEGDALAQLLADFGAAKTKAASPDLFALMAHAQQQMIIASVVDARALLSGVSVQARCLECPPAISPRAEANFFTVWLTRMLS